MPNVARARNPYQRPHQNPGVPPVPLGDVLWAGPGRFAVSSPPDSSDPEWTTAYSPELVSGGSNDGTRLPSAIRIGTREPVESDPNDREYNARQKSEQHKRYRDDQFTPGDWTVQQRKAGIPSNPYWTADVVSKRPTANRSPLGGLFRRPWPRPRNLADIDPGAILHFSMADHRRNYEVFGMVPRGRIGVNTYRAEPRPWDEDLYRPTQAGNSGQAALFGNRAHRLGG